MSEFNSKIDVLLSTFNGECFIVEQLDSILNQTYVNFNLIIRDDGSTDNTLAILDSYKKRDNRIFILNDSLGNLGVVKSFEMLLNYSQADYIFFADQDDVWFSEKINIFISKCLNHNIGSALLVYSDCLIADSNLNVTGKHLNRSSHSAGLNNCLFNFFVQGSCTMINKELKNLVLPFVDKVYVHDRYFHLMAELFGYILYVKEPTMYYRQHFNNQIGAYKSSKNVIYKFLKSKNHFYLKKDKDLVISLIHQKQVVNLFTGIYLNLVDENTDRFKKLYFIIKYRFSVRFQDLLLLLIKN
jgi:rhamnosyltransferase